MSVLKERAVEDGICIVTIDEKPIERFILKRSYYNDGDTFFYVGVREFRNAQLDRQFLDQMYIHAKDEEELKDRLENLESDCVIMEPRKVKQLGTAFRMEGELIEASIYKELAALPDTVTAKITKTFEYNPLYLQDCVNIDSFMPLNTFELPRVFDEYYDFENVDYFSTTASIPGKIYSGNYFTKDRPWVPPVVTYENLIVHKLDQATPVKFKINMYGITGLESLKSTSYPIYEDGWLKLPPTEAL